MRQILVYSDSLSWGIIPGTRNRQPFGIRWPGALEGLLNSAGPNDYRVLEDCINGRRTVYEDPFKAGRNGLEGLAKRVEMDSPLALVILMLGVNDFQSVHPHKAWHSAMGIARLVDEVRRAPIEPGMPMPPVLIVAPPPIQRVTGNMVDKFGGAEEKCLGIAERYEEVAREKGCAFFDAGSVISPSEVDGVHLDAESHLQLAEAMASVVRSLIE